MCSINEDVIHANEDISTGIQTLNLSANRKCFITSGEHKFRAELTKFIKEIGRKSQFEKTNLRNAKRRLLFGFSGNISSVLLLHVLSTERQSNRLSHGLEINVVFIRLPYFSDKWVEKVEQYLKEQCVHFEWRIEEMLFPEVSCVKNSETRQQALILARNRTLAELAKSIEAEGILFASNQTSVAVNLLRDVTLGYAERGGSISGVTDEQTCFNVPVGRPFRALTVKEVALLFRFMEVPPVLLIDLNTVKPNFNTVSTLSDDMISQVGAEYPATASAVFRTGAKLETGDKSHLAHCSICYCLMLSTDDGNICYGCSSLGLDNVLPKYVES